MTLPAVTAVTSSLGIGPTKVINTRVPPGRETPLEKRARAAAARAIDDGGGSAMASAEQAGYARAWIERQAEIDELKAKVRGLERMIGRKVRARTKAVRRAKK